MFVDAHRARFWLLSILLAFVALAPGRAAAIGDFFWPSRIVVFGTSLSDPGNAFLVLGSQGLEGNVSPPDYGMCDTPSMPQLCPDLISLIPSAPYLIAAENRFSNGPTWVEQFAEAIGLEGTVGAGFGGAGLNFAVGGGRASDSSATPNVPLSLQVQVFLGGACAAPSDALYVIEMGGNDIRDVLVGDMDAVSTAVASIRANMQWLYGCGARKFLVWNAPNLALTPALRALDAVTKASQPPGTPLPSRIAEAAAREFNRGLKGVLDDLSGLDGIQIIRFNAFQEMKNVVSHPFLYGLRDAKTACIRPLQSPSECEHPERHFFWDGIHPTEAGHRVIAFLVGKAFLQGVLSDH